MEDGIQPLEAMLYTIERINKNPEILPGIQLGALAFDTCDNPTYALDHLFYFIKGKLSLVRLFMVSTSIHLKSILGLIVRSDRFGSINYRCEDQSVPKFLNSDFDHVVAVLGAESSSVTIQVGIDRVVTTDYQYIFNIFLIYFNILIILLTDNVSIFVYSKLLLK